ncbi:helix-turn-helix domain-containing protein [Photobacterium leiognathi]|uniref:helix-turn-helix domain-containing protein n=1 Tax=Photobacterium leiognathi TaxID=553611 RepID=UPI002735C697|nr:helix-turn-helix domain-containing protein [Photobacterium leiognathi]
MGITIVMLSEAIGVHRNTVSAIVNGKNINVTQAVLLASALGIIRVLVELTTQR